MISAHNFIVVSVLVAPLMRVSNAPFVELVPLSRKGHQRRVLSVVARTSGGRLRQAYTRIEPELTQLLLVLTGRAILRAVISICVRMSGCRPSAPKNLCSISDEI
jgi:hypothetical protein